MAGVPFEPFLNIQHDAAVGAGAAKKLPRGSCGFNVLTAGATGARCGCRTFWSRASASNTFSDGLTPDHCMCGHHACYHEDLPIWPPVEVPTLGQENEMPRSAREPLSPIQEMPFAAGHVSSMHLDVPDLCGAASFTTSRLGDLELQLDEHANAGPDPAMPDTLRFDSFPHGAARSSIPPIPSQCLMPSLSRPSSTTSSSQARYRRPFAGKGLQTLSGVPGSNLRHTLQEVASAQSQVAEIQDGQQQDCDEHGVPATQQDLQATQENASLGQGVAASKEELQVLSTTVQGHEERLEKLESVSFADHEECSAKHGEADIRLADLEGRVETLESDMDRINKERDDGSVVSGRRALARSAGDAASSIVSAASGSSAFITHSAEMISQLQSLQQQVRQLQTVVPSFSHPWEVEVVFLPFALKRVWQESHEFRAGGQDEWTQMPNTISSTAMRAESPALGSWLDQAHDYEWLLPKAFAADSDIDKRLRSRGLVRTVSVKGGDARSVHAAVSSVFGNIVHDMSSLRRRKTVDPRVSRFLGLQQPWVPLRKIHKDSRLRFLTPAEMLTPATWNVQFLASVMMRASEPRLFVTQPEAYLQDHAAYETGWSWQRLRELSRVYAESGSYEVPEADAMEEYWAFNEQLDDAPSAHSSLSLRQSGQDVSSSSQKFYSAQSPVRPSSPVVGQELGALKERRGSRPIQIRTTSLPPSMSAHASPALSKRRVFSYGPERRSSPSIRTTAPAIMKKRRGTRSPSRSARFTPRRTASPSPAPGWLPGEERAAPRGVTPIYYATPHSNAPHVEMRPCRGSEAADHEVLDIYEDEPDDGGDPDYSDSEQDSVASARLVTHPMRHEHGESQQWQLPDQDEPWPGIEDGDEASDLENVDPISVDGQSEDGSEAPSEYPTTQQWHQMGHSSTEFRIHEDDDADRMDSQEEHQAAR